MVIKVCECCSYSTPYSHVFKKHLISNRHMAMKTLVDDNQKCFQCKNCNKKYGTQSGLWKHANKCSSEPADIAACLL